MVIQLLGTTNDPKQFRTWVITMEQRAVSEDAEFEKRIRFLEELLKVAR